jgi:hypothetical protein
MNWIALKVIEILNIHSDHEIKVLLKVIPNLGLHIIQRGEGAFILHRPQYSHCGYLSGFNPLRELGGQQRIAAEFQPETSEGVHPEVVVHNPLGIVQHRDLEERGLLRQAVGINKGWNKALIFEPLRLPIHTL